MDAPAVLVMHRDPALAPLLQAGFAALAERPEVGGVRAVPCRDLPDALRQGKHRAAAGRLAAVVFDADDAGDDLAGWCAAFREHFGEKADANDATGGGEGRRAGPPILALTRDRRVGGAERLFRHGVDDCVAKPLEPRRFAWKLERWLRAARADDDENGLGPVPAALRAAFDRVARDGGRLRDAVAIHSGVAPRLPTYRRMAPPADDWLGVLDAGVVRPFGLGRPNAYLKFAPEALFRLPDPREYGLEKVLVRRVAPPLVAAVDAAGQPFGPDLLGVVPGEGTNAGYLACLLNGRLANFYFNRLWERGARRGATTLAGRDLGELPFARPRPNDLAWFHRAAKLLAFYGPRPSSAVDRHTRDRLWTEANERLFALYGFGEAEVDLLARAHF